MPLSFSAAHSSRITKKLQNRNPLLKRSTTSPFTEFKQRKPIQRSRSKPETVGEEDDFFGDRLDDVGIVKSLSADLFLLDVAQTLQHIHFHMFEAMPESGGFNSTRIAEILNFRKSLPPTVTVSHVHAVLPSPSSTEREIAELAKAGVVRKIGIPGRGVGGSSTGEALILSRDVEKLIKEADGLDEGLTDKYLQHLRSKPTAQSISARYFSPAEVPVLMRAGFLTSSAQSLNSENVFTGPESASPGTSTSISSIARAASGSVAAVGGEDAISVAGGRGGIRRSSSLFANQMNHDSQQPFDEGEEFRLSLPGMGSYLKLLTAARSHLVSLIMKSKFGEVPLYLLRERWDGGISGGGPAAKAKKYRGEFSGVLPSRTRKWKQFYGLSFDWVLAECLGGGLVEVFETRSVGRAIRIS